MKLRRNKKSSQKKSQRHAQQQKSTKPKSRLDRRRAKLRRTSLLVKTFFPLAAYTTRRGAMIKGKVEEVLARPGFQKLEGKVQLLFTSPPFPLNRKKRYDNLQGEEYKNWLANFAKIFGRLLTPTGSVVIELGNAWERGSPVMSTLALESLLQFKKAGDFHLCQQFICHNPSRLPSPAQWVTVKRCRVKDSYTNVWWFSNTTKPKANNRNVLQPYSNAMKKLLTSGTYNAGRRPSQHYIGEKSFLKNNGGAIPSNVLKISNTRSYGRYLKYCKDKNLELHPARMQKELPEFFIKFLTSAGDLVLDPFGGSNTTGAAAEQLDRYWLSFEPVREYVKGSRGHFDVLNIKKHRARKKR